MKNEEFRKELRELLKKHKISYASLTGMSEDNEYIGLIGLGEKNTASFGNVSECVGAIGRLWQHARGVMRDMLNDFEKN